MVRMPMTFVWRNRGRANRQMHVSVDAFQKDRNEYGYLDDEKKKNSQITPLWSELPVVRKG